MDGVSFARRVEHWVSKNMRKRGHADTDSCNGLFEGALVKRGQLRCLLSGFYKRLGRLAFLDRCRLMVPLVHGSKLGAGMCQSLPRS